MQYAYQVNAVEPCSCPIEAIEALLDRPTSQEEIEYRLANPLTQDELRIRSMIRLDDEEEICAMCSGSLSPWSED